MIATPRKLSGLIHMTQIRIPKITQRIKNIREFHIQRYRLKTLEKAPNVPGGEEFSSLWFCENSAGSV